MSEPTTVVLDDGVIVNETATDRIETTVVDAAGGALLPGLIDTHVHVDTASQLAAAARWGVTTVLDMGSRDRRALVALSDGPGLPTVKSAGNPASAPGSMHVKKMGFAVSTTVSGPDDAARFVADRVAEGSDYIKVIVEDPKIPGAKALPPATVTALVAAAHEAGLQTIAHAASADTIATAVRAGVDVVTHTALTRHLGDDVEALLDGAPTAIIPTLAMMSGVEKTIGRRPLMRLLGRVVPGARMDYTYAKSTVATFRRAGMVVLAGTDSNDDKAAPYQVPYGESLHEELERLVDAGLTPVQALRAATSLAAATFGLTDRGVIEPDRRADLLLVDGDPTMCISATRDIRQVWIAGSPVPR